MNNLSLVILVYDLWRAQEGDGATILALLDLLMAFNTINHDILLDWL